MREDEGVPEAFLGNIDGDRDVGRVLGSLGNCGGTAGDGGRLWLTTCVWCIEDMRFIRLVSVGLIVLAPRPVAWEAWGRPGITDIRLFPDPGACEFFAPVARGERGKALDILLDSGVRVLLSAESIDWFIRGGGCTERAFAARDTVIFRDVSGNGREPPSTEERDEVEARTPLSEAMLGLLR